MKILFKTAIAAGLLVLGVGLWLLHEGSVFLDTPPEEKGREVFFDIPPGAKLGQIANELEARGLVTDARKFGWLARYKKLDGRLQAGRFLLNTGWLPDHILDTLVNGQPVLFRVTIPEGMTWWQTGRILEEAGLARFDDFKEIIRDQDFLRHYGIPFPTAEGFLMPDTYLLKKPDSPMPPPGEAGPHETDEQLKAREDWKAQARSVAGRLVDNFWRKAAPLWPERKDQAEGAGNRPAAADVQKWVILASIVEKETRVPSERARVAGVYANRMAKKMLLQADPTVIYGMGPEFSGRLRRVHLDDATNLYNTYQRAGLPPGPIASFGTAALKAAIYPEKHNYLFFVAKAPGDDTHNFSTTFEDHNRAVQEYRRLRNR